MYPQAGRVTRGTVSHHSGRHFLQIPGPTNVPDRVLRAIDAPTIDHRGPAFAELGLEVLEGMRHVLRTSGPVVIYPSSGTGAWEAALVNTLSPGDRVLAFEATRAAVRAWGLEVLCLDERGHSPALTAVVAPDADEVRRVILEWFDMSLGAGLGRLAGRVLRIGHLGDFNDLMPAGTLCGVEMGLRVAGVPVAGSGVEAALERLERAAEPAVA